jgi:small-conductance mechanosensitive channel
MDLTQVLQSTYFGNTGLQIAYTLAIFIITIIVLKLFKTFVVHRLNKLAKKTKNTLDDKFAEFFNELGWFFYFFVAIFVSSQFLTLNGVVAQIKWKMLMIFVVIYVVKLLNKFVEFITELQVNKRDDDDDSLPKLLSMLIKGAIWTIAFVLILANFGIDVTSLIAGLGVGGIAIAFALQKILEDIFASFSIYFDKPFQVGDYIVIGSDSGTVKKIGLKTTRIKHLEGQELVVSNAELTSSRIHNYKKMKKRRISFNIGVEYSTTSKQCKQVLKIVKDVFTKFDDLELDRVHFSEFGDSALIFSIVYYINSSVYAHYMDRQQDINFILKEQFEKIKVEFAYPSQTIYLKK